MQNFYNNLLFHGTCQYTQNDGQPQTAVKENQRIYFFITFDDL